MRPLVWGERELLRNKWIRWKDDDTVEYLVIGFRLNYFSGKSKEELMSDPSMCCVLVSNEVGTTAISFQTLFNEWKLVVREGVNPVIGVKDLRESAND